MRLTAEFAEGFRWLAPGWAIGDEFDLTAHARIIGADEALIDITEMGAEGTRVVNGELTVRLLLSDPTMVV